jgi:hypothetical protein
MTVAAIAALDVAFRGSDRGIMSTPIARPAVALLLPAHHRHLLLTGTTAFGASVLLGALEWSDRPIVAGSTLVNIALVTFVAWRVGRHRGEAEQQPSGPTATASGHRRSRPLHGP